MAAVGISRCRLVLLLALLLCIFCSYWYFFLREDAMSDIQSMFQGVQEPLLETEPGYSEEDARARASISPASTNTRIDGLVKQGSYGGSVGPRSSLNSLEIENLEALAQLYYRNQIGERDIAREGSLQAIQSTYPCLHGKLPIGLDTKRSIQDGHKYVCGLHMINHAPIVYSFGSNGQQDFEEGVLKLRNDAKIYTFELDKLKMVPESKRLDSVQYFNIGLAYKDLNLPNFVIKKEYNLMSLTDIMRMLNHSYVDIVKMDIEGYEVFWLRREKYLLNRIGQVKSRSRILVSIAQIIHSI